MKKILGLTIADFDSRAQWVLKLTCGRMSGTYAEMAAIADRHPEDVRDLDLCAMQPDATVAKVVDLLYSKERMTIPEFFEKYGEG